MTFPVEFYKGDYYRVVHGEEERVKVSAEGWSETRPKDCKYIPISAMPVDAPPATAKVAPPAPVVRPLAPPVPPVAPK